MRHLANKKAHVSLVNTHTRANIHTGQGAGYVNALNTLKDGSDGSRITTFAAPHTGPAETLQGFSRESMAPRELSPFGSKNSPILVCCYFFALGYMFLSKTM